RPTPAQPPFPGVPPPLLLADAIDSRVPELFVSVPFVKRIESLRADAHQLLVTTNAAIARIVVVVLDMPTLQHQVLEPLVAKYFGDRASSDYVVSIVRRDEPATVVYNSSDATVEAAAADVTTGMFDLRMDELNRIASQRGSVPQAAGGARFLTSEKLAITIVRRGTRSDGRGVLMSGAPGDDAS